MRTLTTAELEALRWLDSHKHIHPRDLEGEVRMKGMMPLVGILEELGLVTTSRGPRLTPKGRKQLEQINEDTLKMAKWRSHEA